MYFHNCNTGIYAKDASNVQLTQPAYFTSITSVGINIDNQTILKSTAVGNTGIDIKNANYGVFCKAARFVAQKPKFKECRFGLLAQERSYCSLSTPTFTYSGSTAQVAAGVVLDMSTVASVYGISITGYIEATGSQTGATFKVVNDSILYVSVTADANRANITPFGTARVDTFETSYAGLFASVTGPDGTPISPGLES